MSRPSILIVAGEGRLKSLAQTLRDSGFEVASVDSGPEAAPAARRLEPHVVLVGETVPGGDSLDVCRQIRVQLDGPRRPIFLLAPDASSPRLPGQLTDTQETNRLAEGIRSLLLDRQQAGAAEHDGEQIRAGGLTIDRLRHQVAVQGRVVPLTLTEFRLIWTLAEQPGFVVTRRQLSDACQRAHQSVQERTIDVHIKSIRRKLGRHAGLIETVRGVGYRLSDSVEAEVP